MITGISLFCWRVTCVRSGDGSKNIRIGRIFQKKFIVIHLEIEEFFYRFYQIILLLLFWGRLNIFTLPKPLLKNWNFNVFVWMTFILLNIPNTKLMSVIVTIESWIKIILNFYTIFVYLIDYLKYLFSFPSSTQWM